MSDISMHRHRLPDRVLLVEDEFLVALTLEEDLRAEGCSIVGPFHDLESARGSARSETFDLALLDVNLNGSAVFPLAEELIARGIPFVLLTGYAESNLPEAFRGQERVSKPYDLSDLLEAMRRAAA